MQLTMSIHGLYFCTLHVRGVIRFLSLFCDSVRPVWAERQFCTGLMNCSFKSEFSLEIHLSEEDGWGLINLFNPDTFCLLVVPFPCQDLFSNN